MVHTNNEVVFCYQRFYLVSNNKIYEALLPHQRAPSLIAYLFQSHTHLTQRGSPTLTRRGSPTLAQRGSPTLALSDKVTLSHGYKGLCYLSEHM